MGCAWATTPSWRSSVEISPRSSSMEAATRYSAGVTAPHRQRRTWQPTRIPEPSYELHRQDSLRLDQPGRAPGYVALASYAHFPVEPDQRLPRVVRGGRHFRLASVARVGKTSL